MNLKRYQQWISEKADIGKKLFADPKDPSDALPKWEDYLNRLYRGEVEPNTTFESMIIAQLRKYYEDERNQANAKSLGKLLQELYPLKSKFPAILDPKGYRQVARLHDWELTYPDNVWRGTQIQYKDFIKILPQFRLDVTSNGTNLLLGSNFRLVAESSNYTHKNRSTKGFSSFSGSGHIALSFSRPSFFKSKLPVGIIFGVPLTDPNLLINPEFSNKLSKYNAESETFYMGNQIKPQIMIVESLDVNEKLIHGINSAYRDWIIQHPNIITFEDFFDIFKGDPQMQAKYLKDRIG